MRWPTLDEVMMAAFLVVLAYAGLYFQRRVDDCDAAGGVLVKVALGYECLKVERK